MQYNVLFLYAVAHNYVILCEYYAHEEISIRPDFTDAIKKGIGRNCKIVGNDRYRRLLRELARVNISIRYTLPCIYTSEEKWGKRSLRR